MAWRASTIVAVDFTASGHASPTVIVVVDLLANNTACNVIFDHNHQLTFVASCCQHFHLRRMTAKSKTKLVEDAVLISVHRPILRSGAIKQQGLLAKRTNRDVLQKKFPISIQANGE